MPGKFVVKKGTTGKFRFNLLSTNGQVVATSEAYNSKASAMGDSGRQEPGCRRGHRRSDNQRVGSRRGSAKAAAPVKTMARKVAKKTTAAAKKT